LDSVTQQPGFKRPKKVSLYAGMQKLMKTVNKVCFQILQELQVIDNKTKKNPAIIAISCKKPIQKLHSWEITSTDN